MEKQDTETLDVRDEILEHLKAIERDLAWLARKTGIKYGTLYSCFIQRTFKISDENLVLINKALNKKFKAAA